MALDIALALGALGFFLLRTEVYVAAVDGGWLAGTNAVLRLAQNLEPVTLPETTMSGALIHYISTADVKHFQPMPPNFGILPPLAKRIRAKPERYGAYRDRALADLGAWYRNKFPSQEPQASQKYIFSKNVNVTM